MLYTILVVEDDADINNLLAKMLRQADYQVTQVYSGSEAALRLKHESPDLILLDLMLPGMSGEALLEKLRGELSCDEAECLLPTRQDFVAVWRRQGRAAQARCRRLYHQALRTRGGAGAHRSGAAPRRQRSHER